MAHPRWASLTSSSWQTPTDLLQRHYTTYHEARDPIEPLQGGGSPSVAGRTPIACQNCANAKTGCDKGAPCGRCTEKNLPCETRFARRSYKAALRAAQAGAVFQPALAQPAPSQAQAGIIVASFVDAAAAAGQTPGGAVKAEGNKSPMASEVAIPGIHVGSPTKSSPHQPQLPPHDLPPSPHPRIEGSALDDFMHMTSDFPPPDAAYQDLWPEFSMNLDLYPGALPLDRADSSSSFSIPLVPGSGGGSLPDVSPPSEPTTSASSSSIRTPPTSIMSASDLDNALKPMEALGGMVSPTGAHPIPEFEAVMAAEGAWNLAQCNTAPASCPRTAIVHLECLEQRSKLEGTWSSLERYLEQVDWDPADLTSVVPLAGRTRDKMLAITQSFLHKALEVHRGSLDGGYDPKSRYSSPGDFNFLVLPSVKILEYFLRSYIRSLSGYYPLVAAGCMDPNEMLQNNPASTLLVLLMIAQGAAAIPIAEARYLSAGLTETCRISLFDLVDKYVELSADPTALRCALLFIVLGAWSGDKWLMDIAMRQRGMYMSMLKHAGMLGPHPSPIPVFNDSTSTELEWHAWFQREARNRLVYNYVMLDQELSLFYDTAPMFAITELQCPLPGPEVLWMAPNSAGWLSAMESVYGCIANVNPQLLSTLPATPSLYDLFQDFLHDNLSRGQPATPSPQQPATLSPQQLRLILHPVQALLCHLQHVLSCFSETPSTRRTGARCVTKSSTLHRLEEVQVLLQKWYDITARYGRAHPDCPDTRCNLILYHLISLNAVTDFLEIERFARREAFDTQQGWDWDAPQLARRYVFHREDAVFHCGQVFRLLRMIPNDRQPSWWSAAMYRATLVLWVDSTCRVYAGSSGGSKRESVVSATAVGGPRTTATTPLEAPVIIDQVTPEDPAINAYLWNGSGVAMLTWTDGTHLSLDKPADILSYAIQNIEAGFSLRIGDGIKRKLITLGNNWKMDDVDVAGAGKSGTGGRA
ncbi:hypothetical protein C8A05DRAFT_29403 [Staphylotrichum tortipilum]|uniref:Zn(2)-C6 fungal-type domain-containing protein n=1 Tax=Staphylotrichum tortipilum TaxID=2831512 RepID=A0AAN6MUB2_9PEZI|nr:hypothetical protein C8A05DRAFT_29403 [Staphylotrichum longicolle]